jgi:ATP-dependent Clp protease adapter protein ClpS
VARPWESLARGLRWLTGRPPPPAQVPFDPDADIAQHVANQEARRRGARVTPVHLLYGLLRTDPFLQAIERVGGNAQVITARIAAMLDAPMNHLVWRIHTDLELSLRQRPPYIDNDALVAITSVATTAHHNGRAISAVDLWACVSRTGAGTALAAAGVDPYDVLFVMVHGAPPQDLALVTAHDVDIVLRDDAHSTVGVVQAILRKTFGVSELVAAECTANITKTGSVVVARLPLAEARDRVLAARAIARDHGNPLWIGLDDRPLAPYR